MEYVKNIVCLVTSKLDDELLSIYQLYSHKVDKNNVEQSLKLNFLKENEDLFAKEDVQMLTDLILQNKYINTINNDLALELVTDLLFQEKMFPKNLNDIFNKITKRR